MATMEQSVSGSCSDYMAQRAVPIPVGGVYLPQITKTLLIVWIALLVISKLTVYWVGVQKPMVII